MKNLFFLAISCLLCVSCVPRAFVEADPGSNPAVKTFLDQFDKQEFLKEIDSQKSFYASLVRDLKKEGQDTDELKLNYTDTQRAYNAVLKDMSTDILAIPGVTRFHLFDAEARYDKDMQEAEIKGRAFTEAAMKALDREYDSGALLIFSVTKLFPLIKKVEQVYLNFVKNKMVAQLSEAEFEFWDDI